MLSVLDSFLTVMEQQDQQKAAAIGKHVIKLKCSVHGSNIKLAPIKPVTVATQRGKPTVSCKIILEPIVEKIGDNIKSDIPCQIGTGAARAHNQSWRQITAKVTRSKCKYIFFVVRACLIPIE